MGFHDIINNILTRIDTKLNYPIKVVMNHINSNNIDIQLSGTNKKIGEILHDIILEDTGLSIIWMDGENQIHYYSLEDISIFRSSDTTFSIDDFLNRYEYVGTTTDKKFEIYLYFLFENRESAIDYFPYPNSETELPNINHFKYQNLYTYANENTFIDAIFIEFIVRNAKYNDLLPDFPLIGERQLDDESPEEHEFRMMMIAEEQQSKRDDILLQFYGLTAYEIRELDLSIFKDPDFKNEENISLQLNTIDPRCKNIELDLRLSEEELLSQVKKYKKEYNEERESFFPLKKRVNQEYLKQANDVINKFPKSFKKKQDSLIKSLFIFDYIQATKKRINSLNWEVQEEYESIGNKIIKKYQIMLNEKETEMHKFKTYPEIVKNIKKDINQIRKKKEKELQENKSNLQENILTYPRMDPKYKDCIFHEIASILDEKAGQNKKLHNHIHKFIENNII